MDFTIAALNEPKIRVRFNGPKFTGYGALKSQDGIGVMNGQISRILFLIAKKHTLQLQIEFRETGFQFRAALISQFRTIGQYPSCPVRIGGPVDRRVDKFLVQSNLLFQKSYIRHVIKSLYITDSRLRIIQDFGV